MVTFQGPIIFNLSIDPFAIEVTDLNDDNNLDLIVMNGGAASISVHMNDGNGNFSNEYVYGEPNNSYTVGQYPRFLTSADINNDQKKDILVAVEHAGVVGILIGNGDSTFIKTEEFNVGIPPQAVSTEGLSEDFNSDGNIDLAVTCRGDPNDTSVVTILYGDGNGNFPDTANYRCGENPNMIAKGDFNNDTLIDLAVANSRDTSISVDFLANRMAHSNLQFQ